MGRHAVTVHIDAAIDLLEKHGEPVTPSSVKVNTQPHLTWADYSPEEAADEALDLRIRRRLKDRGYIISDTSTRVRKDFWAATIGELEEQLRVKEESSTYDRNRILADKAVLELLREKQKEFGYAVYPGLFHAEIDRIYAMHSLSSPTRLENVA